MKRVLVQLAVVLTVAVLVHVACIAYAPRVIMAVVFWRSAAHAGGVNTVYYPPPISDTERRVVLPNPDLRYAACSLDLSRGPVSISALPAHTYTSLSIFDGRSDNVFALNDRDTHGGTLQIRVYGPNDRAPSVTVAPDEPVPVQVSTNRALLLLRVLAIDPTMAASIEAALHSLRCH